MREKEVISRRFKREVWNQGLREGEKQLEK